MGVITSVVGSKSPRPSFPTAGNPGVLVPKKVTGVKSPLPVFAASSLAPTPNPLTFIPVKPLPGGGGGGGGGPVGYPIDS